MKLLITTLMALTLSNTTYAGGENCGTKTSNSGISQGEKFETGTTGSGVSGYDSRSESDAQRYAEHLDYLRDMKGGRDR